MRVQGLEFNSYTTGSYQGGKYPGLTLQFSSAAGDYHAIFNVILQYQRNSKGHSPGDVLPGKEFRFKPDSAFAKFWKRIELKPARRASEYHKVMNRLKRLTFAAELANVKTGKLKNSSITAELKEASGSTSEIISLVASKGQRCGSVGTTLGQLGDNSIGQGLGTKIWDKEIEAGYIKSSSQADSSTCVQECVQNSVRDENTTFKVIRIKSKANEGTSCPNMAEQRIDGLSDYQRLQMLNVEDWLTDYVDEEGRMSRETGSVLIPDIVPNMAKVLELRNRLSGEHLVELLDELGFQLKDEQVVEIEVSSPDKTCSHSDVLPDPIPSIGDSAGAGQLLIDQDNDYADCLGYNSEVVDDSIEAWIVEYQSLGGASVMSGSCSGSKKQSGEVVSELTDCKSYVKSSFSRN